MYVEPSKSVENENDKEMQVLRQGVYSEKRDAEVLLRGVSVEGQGRTEETAAELHQGR